MHFNSIKRPFTLLLLLLFLGFHSSIAQEIKVLIDSIAKVHFKDTTNTGLSVGIIQNGKTKTYYYGGKYTHKLHDVDSTTLFEIGSVTKLYTSFIFAALEQEQKISRFDLLAKYLPKSITKGKQWASKIRLVDLATHTSGLPQFDNTKSLIKLEGFDKNNPYGLFTTDFILSILKKTDTLNHYGKVRYSNFGMGVLAYAMAQAKQTTFENLFQQYIRQQQGLSATFLKLHEQQLTNIAIPHRKSEVMPLIQLAALSSAGSIKTTMPDLLQFLHLHISPPVTLQKVVQTVLSNQLKDTDQKVGLGWGIYAIQNTPIFFHNGGTYGSSSIVIIIPSKKSAVAILANDSGSLTNYALKISRALIE